MALRGVAVRKAHGQGPRRPRRRPGLRRAGPTRTATTSGGGAGGSKPSCRRSLHPPPAPTATTSSMAGSTAVGCMGDAGLRVHEQWLPVSQHRCACVVSKPPPEACP